MSVRLGTDVSSESTDDDMGWYLVGMDMGTVWCTGEYVWLHHHYQLTWVRTCVPPS